MVTARSLSPGEEGTLQVSFDGKDRSGKQEKTVRVTTNDPEQEVVVVTIRAYIRAAVILEPSVARIGSLGAGEERIVRLRLVIDDPENVAVRQIGTSMNRISGRIVDGPESDGVKILEVRVSAGMPPGKFQETLTLHTTSPTMPEVEIKVIGVIEGE